MKIEEKKHLTCLRRLSPGLRAHPAHRLIETFQCNGIPQLFSVISKHIEIESDADGFGKRSRKIREMKLNATGVALRNDEPLKIEHLQALHT